jgi:uncharacterized RDD family membrane protein YckC
VGASQIPAPAFAAPGMPASAPPMTGGIGAVAVPYGAVAFPPGDFYAGFWLRLVAYIIDSVVVTFGIGVLFFAGVAIVGAGFFHNVDADLNGADNVVAGLGVLAILTLLFLGLVGGWIYYAWFESSEHQGTLGKMALGLIVTDMQGRRITFARASGRYFSKIVTGLIPLFIGYIMAGFTARKQALHDMMASCLVLRRI